MVVGTPFASAMCAVVSEYDMTPAAVTKDPQVRLPSPSIPPAQMFVGDLALVIWIVPSAWTTVAVPSAVSIVISEQAPTRHLHGPFQARISAYCPKNSASIASPGGIPTTSVSDSVR